MTMMMMTTTARHIITSTSSGRTSMKLSRPLFAATLALLGWPPAAPPAAAATPEAGIIEKATGLKGSYDDKEGVFKVSYPRQDIQARVGGVRVTPELGLTAWTAFTGSGEHVMVMGDIVLLENEVSGVMSSALDAGLQVTALHNHFLRDSPRVMFMHIAGMGSQENMAEAVGRLYRTLKESIQTPPPAAVVDIDPAKTTLNGDAIGEIIGTKGNLAKGVYKIVIGRRTTMEGLEVGKEMGVNTWAAFAGSDEKAVVDGDFAVHENELQAVLKALRHANIDIAAIHNHMVGESPRYVFLHYWGFGSARSLATAIRQALDQAKDR
jgi:hypothetical protein